MSFSVVWKYEPRATSHVPPGVFLITMEDDRPHPWGFRPVGDPAHAGGRMLNLVRFPGFVALLDKVFPNGCGYPPR